MATTISGIAKLSNFENHDMSFVIVQNAESSPHDPIVDGIRLPPLNTTNFEYSPYEFGACNGWRYWLLADKSNDTYGSFPKRQSAPADSFPPQIIEDL